jgi:hypothetical protein
VAQTTTHRARRKQVDEAEDGHIGAKSYLWPAASCFRQGGLLPRGGAPLTTSRKEHLRGASSCWKGSSFEESTSKAAKA